MVKLSDVRAQRSVSREERARVGTLAHAWELYQQAGFCADLRPSSLAGYRCAVRLACEMMPPAPLRGDVEVWLRALVSVRGLSKSTANAYLRAVKAVTSRAQHQAPCDATMRLASAFAVVKQLREDPKERRCPPKDTYWRALQACENPAERAFVGLCVAGMRRNEVLGLRPEHYDRARRVWTVAGQRGRAGASAPRKNGHHHHVECDDALARDCEWTLAHAGELRSRQGMHTGASLGFVFPWGARRVEALFARLAEACPEAFPRGTKAHGLRHLGATLVAELTRGDPQAVQRYLGDRTPNIAMTYCAAVRTNTSFNAASLMGELRSAERQRELVPARASAPAPVADGAGAALRPRAQSSNPEREFENAGLTESNPQKRPRNAVSIPGAPNNNKGVQREKPTSD